MSTSNDLPSRGHPRQRWALTSEPSLVTAGRHVDGVGLVRESGHPGQKTQADGVQQVTGYDSRDSPGVERPADGVEDRAQSAETKAVHAAPVGPRGGSDGRHGRRVVQLPGWPCLGRNTECARGMVVLVMIPPGARSVMNSLLRQQGGAESSAGTSSTYRRCSTSRRVWARSDGRR